MQDPWVRSSLPTRGKAEVDVRTTVRNLTDEDQLTRVKGVIQPGGIEFETEAWVWKGQSREFRFTSQQFEQLIIHNPRLWWPNGYGEPNLYTCTLSVIKNGRVSDTRDISFGIRRYTYDTEGGIFHIRCNDGKHFTPIGTTFCEWSHGWKGTHISLYTYTTANSTVDTQTSPIAHFDDFVYEVEH